MVDYSIAYRRFVSSAKKKMAGIDTKKKLYEFQSANGLEVHHVCPKNLKGSNELKNLVLLTHDEHKYAHLLLNLALVQKHLYGELMHLYYTDLPSNLLSMIEQKKNIFRDLKIDLFAAGKKHAPNTMSIVEAAKIFCILSRQNYENRLVLDSMTTTVIRLAIFSGSKFGYKMKFHM